MVRRYSGLSGEDKTLWKALTKDVKPLEGTPSKRRADTSKKPCVLENPSQKTTRAHKYPSFETDSGTLSSASIAMDNKTYQHMRRGKIPPEAILDLHGKTAAHAQTALCSFIIHSYKLGYRLVLIITGKGGVTEAQTWPSKTARGVLNREMPHWLDNATMRSYVLQSTPAHRFHGGDGAYYVYLRRDRQTRD